MWRVLRIILLSYTADEFTGLPIGENHAAHGERQTEACGYEKQGPTPRSRQVLSGLYIEGCIPP
jgi:hypothetical protein